jgi:hypothetical protein
LRLKSAQGAPKRVVLDRITPNNTWPNPIRHSSEGLAAMTYVLFFFVPVERHSGRISSPVRAMGCSDVRLAGLISPLRRTQWFVATAIVFDLAREGFVNLLPRPSPACQRRRHSRAAANTARHSLKQAISMRSPPRWCGTCTMMPASALASPQAHLHGAEAAGHRSWPWHRQRRGTLRGATDVDYKIDGSISDRPFCPQIGDGKRQSRRSFASRDLPRRHAFSAPAVRLQAGFPGPPHLHELARAFALLHYTANKLEHAIEAAKRLIGAESVIRLRSRALL